jgi:hypothetical protein
MMRSRRLVAVVLSSIALCAVSCTDDDDGTSTTSSVVTSTDVTTPPETTVPTTDTPEHGTLPKWFTDETRGIVTDAESCPDPTGAPMHYRDDALVMFEPRAGAATAIATVLNDHGLPARVADDDKQQQVGIQRLVVGERPSVDVVHALQNQGVAIDFDYLHAPLPNYQPKPDDIPTPAPGDPNIQLGKTAGTIAVVDVGVDSWEGFTVQPSPFTPNAALHVDPFAAVEYHNHGPFIADLLHRYAAAATVELWPVAGAAENPSSGSAAIPGAIDEFSLLSAIAGATHRQRVGDKFVYPDKALEILNLSLGGYGCGVYPHAALAALLAENAAHTLYVAAAGNDGEEHYLFPAAFAAGNQLVTEVANRPAPPQGVVDDVATALGSTPNSSLAIVGKLDELITRVAGAMVSVGSATPQDEWPATLATDKADPNGDCFSNRGSWVLAWAPGAFQISRLDERGWYYWSGTSFATPRFSAAVLEASGNASMSPRDFWDDASAHDATTYEAVGYESIRFGLTPTKDFQSPGCT